MKNIEPCGVMTCEEWLADYLDSGEEYPTILVMNAARAAGFTRGQVRDARRALGVKTTNDGEVWYWKLEAKA